MTFPALMTAMATPFDGDGRLDLPAAQALAAHLVDHGSGGLVVAGTTGESPTLSGDEALDLFRAVAEAVGDRAAVVAGTGSYDTASTITRTQHAAKVGVDGIMLVTPYYNRPNQRGLDRHFRAVAAAVDLPVMLYNIPARTACEIAPETLLGLAEDVESICAVKDAVGDMAKASWLAARAPADFQILSGDDKNCLPLLAVGGAGLVSVAAHLVGDDLARMIEVFPTDPAEARAIHWRLGEIFAVLFAEPSPAPLKAALAMLDLPGGALRLPMVDVADDTAAAVRRALVGVGLLTDEEVTA
ncbi:4-hydroxy-tetrahydrodipicolinate synthase [Euzebya sp.]|uniref:4-hydroxy-tetrahydrodipicolinate synthase n=1 Tax=Euzebya sp. TaxID=1971409 RepID=UPI0035172377